MIRSSSMIRLLLHSSLLQVLPIYCSAVWMDVQSASSRFYSCCCTQLTFLCIRHLLTPLSPLYPSPLLFPSSLQPA